MRKPTGICTACECGCWCVIGISVASIRAMRVSVFARGVSVLNQPMRFMRGGAPSPRGMAFSDRRCSRV